MPRRTPMFTGHSFYESLLLWEYPRLGHIAEFLSHRPQFVKITCTYQQICLLLYVIITEQYLLERVCYLQQSSYYKEEEGGQFTPPAGDDFCFQKILQRLVRLSPCSISLSDYNQVKYFRGVFKLSNSNSLVYSVHEIFGCRADSTLFIVYIEINQKSSS